MNEELVARTLAADTERLASGEVLIVSLHVSLHVNRPLLDRPVFRRFPVHYEFQYGCFGLYCSPQNVQAIRVCPVRATAW